jgi:hypothetical protein
MATTTDPKSRTDDDAPAPRQGDELMDAAARGAGVTPAEEDALLAYYLGDAPQPNSKIQRSYTVDLGEGRQWQCTVRSITWAEWQDAQRRAIDTQNGNLDIYKQASYVVARGMVRPLLGRLVERVRDAASEGRIDPARVPADGAAYLERAFANQAGSLIYLQRKVLELSRLDEAGEGGVREVEAAKA